jgi:hypothetical protein
VQQQRAEPRRVWPLLEQRKAGELACGHSQLCEAAWAAR